ncbi:GATOR1 complex protein NPRL3 isoform 1-T1 [Theristicus caerulescens]
MGESTSPISVILVSSGSRGNKLLFRFPFQRGAEHPAAQANKPRSRYAVNSSGDTTEDQDGDSRQLQPTRDNPTSGLLIPGGSSSGSACKALCRTLAVHATINVWHPVFLSLVGMEAPEPIVKSCGSFGAAQGVPLVKTLVIDSLEKELKFRICSKSDCNLFYFLLRDQCPLTDEQLVSGFSDVILATILATKSDMCGKKFELKIDNVRFVGHPTLLQHALGQVSKTDPSPKREMPTMILFNVVFALRANADPSVINCLHNLSRRIAIVLQHEERRCQYLTREAKLILAIQDEVSAMSETTEGPQSPFHHILPKCKLARDLKETYDSLCTTGVVRLHINNWLEVSFCLPHKIHYVATNFIPPEAIERSLKSIRPYHALLLLNDEKSLLNELPLDCSPALVRVIKTTSAVKNLQQLAQDADLALLQVFQLAAHLVYWGKAIIIYPLCENNVYMLSPNASVCLYSPLADAFSCQFRGHNLPSMLSKFSLPVSLSEFKNPLAPPVQETQLIQMVIWMLQHRLLIQLHTYVCLMVPPNEEDFRAPDEDMPFTARVGGRSLSTPNALSFGSPTSSDDMTLTSPSMDNSSAELIPGGDSPLNKRMTENLLASLLEHEREAILNVPAAQNPEDLRMFARLLHYFRGRHHLEEIMYNENMRRSQLLMLFDKFRSVLVVTSHEDPVISVFQSLLK